MNITLVPPANVDNVWPMVSGLVVDCLRKAPSYLSAGELWQQCRAGTVFLFVVHDGEKVTGVSIWEFGQSFGRPAFNCLVLAGDGLENWVADLVEVTSKMARDGGAGILCATGRVGLLDPLKKKIAGVKVARQTYTVEI